MAIQEPTISITQANDRRKEDWKIYLLFFSNFMIRFRPFTKLEHIIPEDIVFFTVLFLDIINIFVYRANKNNIKRITKIHRLTLLHACILCVAYSIFIDSLVVLSVLEVIPIYLPALMTFMIIYTLYTSIYALIAVLILEFIYYALQKH